MTDTLKKRIAIVAPLFLIAMMYPVFQLLALEFTDNWRIGWFLGLLIYWIIWGILFPLIMIGKRHLLHLIGPQRLNVRIFLLIAFPLVIVVINKFIHLMDYDKPSTFVFILLLITAFGNGVFEEIFWRGVYLKLFPGNLLLRVIWPGICFGLWHFAPASVAPDGRALTLVIGAVFFGFYLSYLARGTNGIWWPVVTHILSGFIVII